MTRKKNTKRRTGAAHSTAVRSNRSRANFTAAPKRRNRKRNPAGVTRRRRRRNPQLKGMVTNAFWAIAGAWATKVVSGFIPIRAGGWAGIGIQLGTAYLTGVLAQKFVSPANAQMMAIGGAASAAGQIVDMLFGTVKGMTGSLFNSGDGVGDVSQAPDWYLRAVDESYTLPPATAVAPPGLNDVSSAPAYYQ
jgi:hypothetical protein